MVCSSATLNDHFGDYSAGAPEQLIVLIVVRVIVQKSVEKFGTGP